MAYETITRLMQFRPAVFSYQPTQLDAMREADRINERNRIRQVKEETEANQKLTNADALEATDPAAAAELRATVRQENQALFNARKLEQSTLQTQEQAREQHQIRMDQMKRKVQAKAFHILRGSLEGIATEGNPQAVVTGYLQGTAGLREFVDANAGSADAELMKDVLAQLPSPKELFSNLSGPGAIEQHAERIRAAVKEQLPTWTWGDAVWDDHPQEKQKFDSAKNAEFRQAMTEEIAAWNEENPDDLLDYNTPEDQARIFQLRGRNITDRVNALKAQTASEKLQRANVMAPKNVAGAQKETLEALDLENFLNEVDNTLDDGTGQWDTTYMGTLGQWGLSWEQFQEQYLGKKEEDRTPLEQQVYERGLAVTQLVGARMTEVLHKLAGATQTQAEVKRIMRSLLNMNMTPTAFKAAYNHLRKQVEWIKESRAAALEVGVSSPAQFEAYMREHHDKRVRQRQQEAVASVLSRPGKMSLRQQAVEVMRLGATDSVEAAMTLIKQRQSARAGE